MEVSKKIEKNDAILAMLTKNGNVMAQINSTNYNNISELIVELKNKVAEYPGLFQLFIRNFSKGWHINQPIFVKNKTKVHPQKQIITKDAQYCINFN